MNLNEINIHSQRVLNELDSIGSDAAWKAIDYCNRPNGLVQLHLSVQACSAYDTIADLMMELAAEEIEITYGKCISDEELADELENLTQDEAAELAETIEAERKKAQIEFINQKRT